MKRIFTYLLILLLSFSLFAFPAFAAGYATLHFYIPASDTLNGQVYPIPVYRSEIPAAVYHCDLFLSFENNTVALQNFTLDLSDRNSYYASSEQLSIDLPGIGSFPRACVVVEIGLDETMTFSIAQDGLIIAHGADVEFVMYEGQYPVKPVEPAPGGDGVAMDSVDDGLVAAISWVGDVAYALMYGPLSGLLGMVAIAISISALVLVIKVIRKLGWGM